MDHILWKQNVTIELGAVTVNNYHTPQSVARVSEVSEYYVCILPFIRYVKQNFDLTENGEKELLNCEKQPQIARLLKKRVHSIEFNSDSKFIL